jgi:hypothetical protein
LTAIAKIGEVRLAAIREGAVAVGEGSGAAGDDADAANAAGAKAVGPAHSAIKPTSAAVVQIARLVRFTASPSDAITILIAG